VIEARDALREAEEARLGMTSGMRGIFGTSQEDLDLQDQEIANLKEKLRLTQEARDFVLQSKSEDESGETASSVETLVVTAEEEAAAQLEIDTAKQMGEALHFNIMHQIEADSITARLKLKDKEAKSRKKIEAGMWSNVIGLMHSGNKQAFEIGKTAALAQAIFKGKSTVVSAFEAGMSTGGPWAPFVAAAYATSAAASVAGQISALQNTSFGGGGSVSAGTVSTATPSLPSPAGDTGAAATDESTQSVEIVVSGGLHTDIDMGGQTNLVAVSR